MPDGPRRAPPGRAPLRPDGGTAADPSGAGTAEASTTDRGPYVAVGLTVLLGVVALYAVLGGPLPFVVEGGPSLDAVPAEADAVVYADAWAFAGESSQEIVDGLLVATNRSLPGYTGPASLQSAAENLRDTRLNPEGLRSVTAFGAYGPAGRSSDYRAVVLKTGWRTDPLLAAFGGGAEEYQRRTYRNTTVYVHEDPRSEFAWVGVLGSEEFVLGTETAVTDAIDANAGRDAGIDARLRTRFLAMGRGPLRFAASMPDSIPGDAIAPKSLTEAIDAIETVAGVYRPQTDGAAVDLSVSASEAEALDSIEPAVADGLAFARRNAPEGTAELLAGATLSRADATLTVSLSGSTSGFVDGYGAVLETDLVQLLLGLPVGEPALELVPADADVVGYADAAVVVDPTTLGFVDAVGGQSLPGPDVAAAIEQLRETTTLDVTALRSVTWFGHDGTAGAVVEADWSPRAIARTLEAGNVSYTRRTVGGATTFDLSAVGQVARIAVLDDGHLVLGTPSSVGAVLGVANGSQQALGTPLGPAFERLPRGYATVVGYVPGGVGSGDGTLGQVLAGIEILGGSYDTTRSRVSLEVQMGFDTDSAARNAGAALELGRQVVRSQVDNESTAALLSGTSLSRDGRVVTATVLAEPEDVVRSVAWLASGNASLPSLPTLSLNTPEGSVATAPAGRPVTPGASTADRVPARR